MKLLLIDDEPLALDFLEIQLKKVRNTLDIHKFTIFDMNANKNLLLEADLLLLDIEMPHINGLELATQITEVNPSLPIVFVTAYNEYAIQAFEMNALDYLMKPVQLDRLSKTLERTPFPAKVHQTEALLRIKVCNEFRIETSDGQFSPVQWRTKKAQELFLYLLHHSGKIVPKTKILDVIWTDVDLDKAYAQLYTTIYYIRRNMLAYDEHFSLKSAQGGYKLNTKHVEIGIIKWKEEILLAPSIQNETIELHEQIMSLYTGGYLEAYHYTWAEGERFRLEQVWVEQATKIATYYNEEHQLEKAVAWFDKVTKIRPEDEDTSFMLMQIYAQLNYGLLVNHQYKQHANALKELDIPIAPQIREWYDNWKIKRAGNTPV